VYFWKPDSLAEYLQNLEKSQEFWEKFNKGLEVKFEKELLNKSDNNKIKVDSAILDNPTFKIRDLNKKYLVLLYKEEGKIKIKLKEKPTHEKSAKLPSIIRTVDEVKKLIAIHKELHITSVLNKEVVEIEDSTEDSKNEESREIEYSLLIKILDKEVAEIEKNIMDLKDGETREIECSLLIKALIKKGYVPIANLFEKGGFKIKLEDFIGRERINLVSLNELIKFLYTKESPPSSPAFFENRAESISSFGRGKSKITKL
jgi:hypothetical protein